MDFFTHAHHACEASCLLKNLEMLAFKALCVVNLYANRAISNKGYKDNFFKPDAPHPLAAMYLVFWNQIHANMNVCACVSTPAVINNYRHDLDFV